MNAQEKMDKLTELLRQGREVWILTHYKQIRITKCTLNDFEKSGCQLFKVYNNSLFVARGKKWDCIDFCRIEIR